MSRLRSWHCIVLAGVCAAVAVWGNQTCNTSEALGYAGAAVWAASGAFAFLSVWTRRSGRRVGVAIALGIGTLILVSAAMVITADC